MRSDIISIDNKGNGVAAALAEAKTVAQYRGLNDKETLQIEILTEELMSLARSVTGELAASFWIDSENKDFTLHLSTKTKMDASKRYQLISTSTANKNEAAKGFLGFLRDKFESAMLQEEGYHYDVSGNLLDEAAEDKEWDRYERSILRRLSDEIKIGVRGGKVEMEVKKSF